SGKVTAVNDSLSDDPELVNREAEESGWLFKLQVSEAAVAELEPLMDQAAYEASLE
ncbi:MAG: glycine cleavage system protein H, partial [Candidatus Porifericomitaceae bacterium WSBS_2022_MAG_OTU9]